MKRLFAAVLCLIMVLGMFGCTKPATNDETPAVTAPASDVEMQYITPDEAAALLGNDATGGLCDSEVFILTTYINEMMDRTIDTFHRFGNNVSVIMLGELQD